MKISMNSIGTLMLTLAAPAMADQVFNDDVIVDGRLCAGAACADGELFNGSAAKFNSNQPDLQFDDTGPTGEPDRDWRIMINDAGAGGLERFAIKDDTSTKTPFTILGDAPENGFYMASDGDIGFGTALPAQNVHILSDNTVSLRLETTFLGANPTAWDLDLYAVGSIGMQNVTTGNTPFKIEREAPTNSLFVQDDGFVGLGTQSPNAPFEVHSSGSFNFFRITATGAAVNDSVDIVFTQGPLGTGQLRYNIVEAGDSPQVPEMTLDADGNMTLAGTLTTTGATCTGGCDRVFDADYALPSIRDHAAQMRAAGHLPVVGPTQPGQPMNVTEQMGNMLNALEHAHLYIAQLEQQQHDRVLADRARMDAQDALIANLTARLAQVETR